MSTKKRPAKVVSMFSLKRYLKKQADDRLALLQLREEKRKNKPEAIKAARKLARARAKAYDPELDVTEEAHDHSHCGDDCGHEHT
jgi:hypothetical protein